MKRFALISAGIIFTLVALSHLLRIFYHIPIIVSGEPITMAVSYIGLIVTGILAIWMFVAASKSRH